MMSSDPAVQENKHTHVRIISNLANGKINS